MHLFRQLNNELNNFLVRKSSAKSRLLLNILYVSRAKVVYNIIFTVMFILMDLNNYFLYFLVIK